MKGSDVGLFALCPLQDIGVYGLLNDPCQRIHKEDWVICIIN